MFAEFVIFFTIPDSGVSAIWLLFFSVGLTRELSILLVFPKNQFMMPIFPFISIILIYDLIYIVYFSYINVLHFIICDVYLDYGS